MVFVHNVLMVGRPGAGKTLLARAMPGILPEMSIEESLDVTRIYSVADQLPAGTPLIRHRPFRSRQARWDGYSSNVFCQIQNSIHLPFGRYAIIAN